MNIVLWLAIVFAAMAFIFVMPIFVVSAISNWWEIRRFRRSLGNMQGSPWEPPGAAGE